MSLAFEVDRHSRLTALSYNSLGVAYNGAFTALLTTSTWEMLTFRPGLSTGPPLVYTGLHCILELSMCRLMIKGLEIACSLSATHDATIRHAFKAGQRQGPCSATAVDRSTRVHCYDIKSGPLPAPGQVPLA